MTSETGSPRLHGLDAVRGYALLLGIVFHASMSFLPAGVPIWVAEDNQRSAVLAAVAFASHMFRMTTFFVIAGFFAHMTFHKRGAKGFIVDRAKRIALPLIVFWPFVMAGIIAAGAFAIYQATGSIPSKPPAGPPAPPGAFPFTHLWFLYVLVLLYAATLTVRGITARLDRSGGFRAKVDGVVGFVVRNPLAPVVLALPVAVAFHEFPAWIQWFGVPTPDSNVVPALPSAVQYGLAFGFGWLLHRQGDLLEVFRRRWALNLAAALAATAACLAMIGLTVVVVPPKPGMDKLVYAAAYAIGIWTWTFAVIGMAMRFLNTESPVRRYIADSSYWLYLIHLPLVMALQAWVAPLGWPWPVKFAAILGVAFAVMFATYHLLVRRTVLGGWLNGRRTPKTVKGPAKSPGATLETA